MAWKPLQIIAGLLTEVEALLTSAGAGDSGKIPALDATGRLDTSFMPAGIGADTKSVVTSENLTAGDFVNLYDASGTLTCRKADASTASAGKRAHGFVLASTTSPASATVYFEGANGQRSGLTVGATYVLSAVAAGGVTIEASGTTTAGHILQKLGVATSATEINVEIDDPMVRA